MNDNNENLSPEQKQDNQNNLNTANDMPVFSQANPRSANIENSPSFFSDQPQSSLNNVVKPPKNKKPILIIAIVSVAIIILGAAGVFVVNNMNKAKTSSNANTPNNTANSGQSTVAFASDDDKQIIKDLNDKFGVRFDNQVILTERVPIDLASSNPKEYDGVAVVAVDVSSCNHISIKTESSLTCYVTEDESDYYYVVLGSNDLSAYDNFREIASTYKDQDGLDLVFKGVAYDDVNVYTSVYKNGILHAYFGHLGVSGQYSPYFYVAFNKNNKNDTSFDDQATVDSYYKKISIINVPNPVN